MMKIEFDADKDEVNRFKHSFGGRIFDDPDHLILPSFRPIDGEDRYKVTGKADGKLYTAIYTIRGERLRMISVRRSNAREQRDYNSNPG